MRKYICEAKIEEWVKEETTKNVNVRHAHYKNSSIYIFLYLFFSLILFSVSFSFMWVIKIWMREIVHIIRYFLCQKQKQKSIRKKKKEITDSGFVISCETGQRENNQWQLCITFGSISLLYEFKINHLREKYQYLEQIEPMDLLIFFFFLFRSFVQCTDLMWLVFFIFEIKRLFLLQFIDFLFFVFFFCFYFFCKQLANVWLLCWSGNCALNAAHSIAENRMKVYKITFFFYFFLFIFSIINFVFRSQKTSTNKHVENWN